MAFKANDYVVVRAGGDAQVYTLKSIEGYTAKLSYPVGRRIAFTECDVSLLRKPSEEQMKKFLL